MTNTLMDKIGALIICSCIVCAIWTLGYMIGHNDGYTDGQCALFWTKTHTQTPSDSITLIRNGCPLPP